MSVLLQTVFRNECRGTHHKLAINALRQLEGEHAEQWRNLILRYYEEYLEGAKAPDKSFRDFRNHVLHVSEGDWGGAVEAAQKWYDRLVASLKKKRWPESAYCAGVLSHYYTDPLQPLHTGQSEAEAAVHRAVEWSVSRSFDELLHRLESDLGGYPQVSVPGGDDWLAQMVRDGARHAHPYYQQVLEHYDLERGVKSPAAGLNHTLRDIFAHLLGYATTGFARILERAFADAKITPPGARIGLLGWLTALTCPFAWFAQWNQHRRERKEVRAIAREFWQTGRVRKYLPAEQREVRRMHAEEVLKISLEQLDAEAEGGKAEGGKAEGGKAEGGKAAVAPPAELGAEQAASRPTPRLKVAGEPASEHSPTVSPTLPRQSHGTTATGGDQPVSGAGRSARIQITARSTGTDLRGNYHLEPTSALVDAPSIGPKTAKRLGKLGLVTVQDLLDADPQDVAEQVQVDYVTSQAVSEWQLQAGLMCRIPNLRGHDAQMLVGSGFSDPHELAEMKPETVLEAVESFLISDAGERVLRGSREPDLREVQNWIRWAGQARQLAAA